MKHIILYEYFNPEFLSKPHPIADFKRDNFAKKSDFDTMPDEFKDMITSWEYFYKSPWSDSFYNMMPSWDSKHDGELRIADHWNFEKNGKLHCKTNRPVRQYKFWSLGVYDKRTDTYTIIKTLPKKQLQKFVN